jgi:hypothetical protein
LVNLTAASSGREPIDDIVPVGPLKIRVHLPANVRGRRVQLRVAGTVTTARMVGGWAQFDVPSVAEHELIVIE